MHSSGRFIQLSGLQESESEWTRTVDEYVREPLDDESIS